MKRLLLLLGLFTGPLCAQLVTYTFGPAASPTTAPTAVASLITAGAFTGLSGSPGTASGSPVHAGGSGGSFFTASTWTGAAPGTNHFQFSVTPVAGHLLDATSISFAYRATTTGPVSFALRSSADSFATNVLSGTLSNDAIWRTVGPLALVLDPTDGPLVLRLYAAGASSALGTLRLDDVSLGGTVTAVPEPGAAAVILGLAGLAVAALVRRHRRTSGWGQTKGAAISRP